MSHLLILGETIEYTLKSDREKPDSPRFILAPLDVRTRARLADSVTEFYVTSDMPKDRESGQRMKANEQSIEMVRHGLRGWRNLPDAQGNPVEFKTGKDGLIDEDILKRMPLQMVQELAKEVGRISNLQEQDEKN